MDFVLPLLCIMGLSYIVRAIVSRSNNAVDKSSHAMKKKFIVINVVTYCSGTLSLATS
jgi:hypothetical protein